MPHKWSTWDGLLANGNRESQPLWLGSLRNGAGVVLRESSVFVRCKFVFAAASLYAFGGIGDFVSLSFINFSILACSSCLTIPVTAVLAIGSSTSACPACRSLERVPLWWPLWFLCFARADKTTLPRRAISLASCSLPMCVSCHWSMISHQWSVYHRENKWQCLSE